MANNDAAEASRPNKKSKVEQPPPKATKAPVPGKGLRHFSMKICDRVKSKGSTSYSEVADEVRAHHLVHQIILFLAHMSHGYPTL